MLIGDSSTEAETARAARLLGFPPGQTVRVIAISGPGNIDEPTRADAQGTGYGDRQARRRPRDERDHGGAYPRHVQRPGCHPRKRTRGHAARRGLRFTSLPGRRWTTADELGCLVALADVDPAHANALPDVQAISKVSTGRAGRDDLALLDNLRRLDGGLEPSRKTP